MLDASLIGHRRGRLNGLPYGSFAIALDRHHPTAHGKRAEVSRLRLHKTPTRAKKTSVPADPSGRVGLLVRGPTVYDLPHLGRAQDLHPVRLPRAPPAGPRHRRHVRAELTDVDDKIIRRARELGIDPSELARTYARAYLDHMRALRNNAVDVDARASD